ncbi:MAG TPA: hypothetical protein VGF95_09710 [Solirubrobacteraceae bacterium]|jgi:hypothetical protein
MRISFRLAAALAAGTMLAASPSALAGEGAGTAAKAKGHKKPAKHKSTKAKGKTVKVTGGTITFALTSTTALALDNAKVVLAPVAPATGTETSISMPITSGKLNTATGDGSVVAGGEAPAGNGFTLTQTTEAVNLGIISFGGGEEQFSLSAPVTVTIGGVAKYGPGTGTSLTANINDSTTPSGPFFTLKGAKPKVKGSSLTIANMPAMLTSPAAEVLSFQGVSFTSGEEMATVTISATT